MILSSKTSACFLQIAATHGFGLPGALLGVGGPGEERAHGCGGGEPAVRVGGLHGEKHTPMLADLTPLFQFCCTYSNRQYCRENPERKEYNQLQLYDSATPKCAFTCHYERHADNKRH